MKTFQVTRLLRTANRMVTWLLGLGLPIGPTALLTVRGRRSQLPGPRRLLSLRPAMDGCRSLPTAGSSG